jgi:hypothetical protein
VRRRYATGNLHEPRKAELPRWKPGESFRREALADPPFDLPGTRRGFAGVA